MMEDLVGSMIDAIFSAASNKRAPTPPRTTSDSPAPAMPAQTQGRPAGSAASKSRPAQTAHDSEEARAAARMSGPLSGLFEDGNSLVRAVVAAELLGPPIALRENQLWQIRRPNERST